MVRDSMSLGVCTVASLLFQDPLEYNHNTVFRGTPSRRLSASATTLLPVLSASGGLL